MASNYPTAYDVFDPPPSTLAGPVAHSLLHRQATDALAAIQAELGLNPSGSAATVASKLAAAVTAQVLLSARPLFVDINARENFYAAYAPLADYTRCRVGYVDMIWLTSAWYPEFAGATFAGATDGNGVVTVAHNIGKIPSRLGVTVASSAVQNLVRLVVTAVTATTFTVKVYRNDDPAGALTLNGNPVAFFWWCAL